MKSNLKRFVARLFVFFCKLFLKVTFKSSPTTLYFRSFLKALHIKARELGMKNTHITIPSGKETFSNSISTAKDIMHMMIGASKNKTITTFFNKDTKEVQIEKMNCSRKISIETTLKRDLINKKYPILFSKTGSWDSKIFNIAVIAEICNQKVVAVIMDSHSDNNRYKSLNQLLDISFNKLSNENYDTTNIFIEGTTSAIACVITDDNNHRILFEQNPDAKLTPASVIKVLTVLTALDYIDNCKTDSIYANFFDVLLDNDKTDCLTINESITYEDAIHLMLLPSSNQAAMIVAKNIGKKIYKNKK